MSKAKFKAGDWVVRTGHIQCFPGSSVAPNRIVKLKSPNFISFGGIGLEHSGWDVSYFRLATPGEIKKRLPRNGELVVGRWSGRNSVYPWKETFEKECHWHATAEEWRKANQMSEKFNAGDRVRALPGVLPGIMVDGNTGSISEGDCLVISLAKEIDNRQRLTFPGERRWYLGSHFEMANSDAPLEDSQAGWDPPDVANLLERMDAMEKTVGEATNPGSGCLPLLYDRITGRGPFIAVKHSTDEYGLKWYYDGRSLKDKNQGYVKKWPETLEERPDEPIPWPLEKPIIAILCALVTAAAGCLIAVGAM